MSTVTEWLTDEERPAVEEAIQGAMKANGHPPLSPEALSIIICHAGRMAVAFRGSLVSNALAIVRALYPAPKATEVWPLVAALHAEAKALIVDRGAPPPPYRPEPPQSRRRFK